MSTDRGIDYGLGKTNLDQVTGIRYGVIPQHQLNGDAIGDFEAVYGPATCPKCGRVADAGDQRDIDRDGYEHLDGTEFACDECRVTFDGEHAYPDEPEGWVYDGHGYRAHLDSSGDAWVTSSPYYTRAQFCSPCAPGACHLAHPTAQGDRCYCFGHDWFDDGVAPYPVFDVLTDQVVRQEDT